MLGYLTEFITVAPDIARYVRAYVATCVGEWRQLSPSALLQRVLARDVDA